MVKVYFWGPGTLLKCGPHDGPVQSYLPHGLLAVYAEVGKGHKLWHMYTAYSCKKQKVQW